MGNQPWGVVGGVVAILPALAIAGLFWAFLIDPFILDVMATRSSSEWSSGGQALWAMMDTALLLSILLGMFGIVYVASRG